MGGENNRGLEMVEKLKIDVFLAEHVSFIFSAKIIFPAKVVFLAEGTTSLQKWRYNVQKL